MAFAVLLLIGIELALVANFSPPNFKPADTPILVAIIALFGAFLVFCGWMLVRLIKGVPSSNGVTILPVWFISGFGAMFIAGAVFAAWHGAILTLLETLSIGLAMVFVGRLLRRSRARSDAAVLQAGAVSDHDAAHHAIKVRVFDLPPGEAPEWVRRAWVGLDLPLTPGNRSRNRCLPLAKWRCII
jgi:hypothetical protein